MLDVRLAIQMTMARIFMNDNNQKVRDKIAGSLYGLLTGDAFGCPVEGWPPSKIQAVYGTLEEMVEATERWRPAGLHSDDGQQAMALCDAVLAQPGNPAAGFARTLVRMHLRGHRKGHGYSPAGIGGRGTRQAVTHPRDFGRRGCGIARLPCPHT